MSAEVNIEQAGSYIKQGNKNLEQAIQYQKKTRKCYCCLLIVSTNPTAAAHFRRKLHVQILFIALIVVLGGLGGVGKLSTN
jgi:hypothetical protein